MSATEPSSLPTVSFAELEEGSRLFGRGFAVDGVKAEGGGPALSGEFRMVRLRPGITLHTSDVTEFHDATTRVEQTPGVTIHVFLEGVVEATTGGRPLGLGRRDGEAVKGVIVARAEPDLFERHSRPGLHLRKVNVTLSREWLEESGFDAAEDFHALRDFSASHLARFAWTPGPGLVSLAEQMLHPPGASPMMQRLYLESRALDLIAEAFGALTAQAPVGSSALRPFDRRRLQVIEDYLAEHGHEVISLDEIARNGGVSVSTLRRLFSAAHGTTVFDYLRRRGLERARLALERQGVAVAEAAYLAGYTSAANFATAFKRHFGVSPREVRRH